MNRAHRRSLLVLVLMLVPILSAQHSEKGGRKNSFTSPDGTFQFDYPASLVRCAEDPNQHGWWKPPESCEAYIPVCPDVSGASGGTIACIAYPAKEMEGTNFEAAAFAVSEQKAMTTNAECLKIEEPQPQVANARKEKVNGVMFTVVETDGVATGHLSNGYVYRAFLRSKCYELDIRIASNIGYDPDIVKSFDMEKVRRTLKAVLESFSFVR